MLRFFTWEHDGVWLSFLPCIKAQGSNELPGDPCAERKAQSQMGRRTDTAYWVRSPCDFPEVSSELIFLNLPMAHLHDPHSVSARSRGQ